MSCRGSPSYCAVLDSSTGDQIVVLLKAIALVEEFVDDHLNDGGRRNGEDGAYDAEQRAADEQRHEDDDGADAHLAPHHLGHEDVVFDLLLEQEEDGREHRSLVRDREGDENRRHR